MQKKNNKIYNLQEDGSSASVTFGTVSTALFLHIEAH